MLQLGPIVFSQANWLAPSSVSYQWGRWEYRVENTNIGPVVRRQHRGITVIRVAGSLGMKEGAARTALLRRVTGIVPPPDEPGTAAGELAPGRQIVYNESIQGYYLDGTVRQLVMWDHRYDNDGNLLLPRTILGDFLVADFNTEEIGRNAEHAEALNWNIELVQVPNEEELETL